MEAKRSTVDEAEVERFSRIAHEWWNPHGKFAPLHRINEIRVGWIVEQVERHWGLGIGDWRNAYSLMPRTQSAISLTVLDVGCGGGLVSEAMARAGATVTGIDASRENIEVAKLHAAQSGLNIDYRNTTAEELLSSPRLRGESEGGGNIMPPSPNSSRKREGDDGFDVVLALEIVEHVADVSLFVETVCKLVKPGGLLIMSTLNRTAKSFALGIVAAEYVLRWLPKGTHTWDKFIKPHELAAHLRHNGIEIKEMTGLVMNPLTWTWELDAKDLGVNYLMAGRKL